MQQERRVSLSDQASMVVVEHLLKRFGSFNALSDINLNVAKAGNGDMAPRPARRHRPSAEYVIGGRAASPTAGLQHQARARAPGQTLSFGATAGSIRQFDDNCEPRPTSSIPLTA
ncbi:hypothetical protein [Bradyrhizobium ivorense]|uniref:hypothetical protein n=1 Tax=Bradyrhizobium ivorense TaxID=2511166 RepID=UPI0015898D1F|nr:hypothetical protein [Bradyrhizobium ivorense]